MVKTQVNQQSQNDENSNEQGANIRENPNINFTIIVFI